VQEILAMLDAAQAGTGGVTPSPDTAEVWATLSRYWATQTANGTVSREQVQVACLLADPHALKTLVAISVASVFFGACTYIGNGPNFMVKAIADHQKVHTPTFLGYVVKFTLPFLLPMLALVWLLFFRH
jgi:Na+/H+ antiporter NhaD/arsenite permease-like protein